MTGGVSASRHGWSGRGSGAMGCGLLLLTVQCGATLLVLSGCVVGDEGLVLLVCLTFVWFGGFLVGVKKALESSTSMPLLACGISER